MNCLFQIVDTETGRRSEVMERNRMQFADDLKKVIESNNDMGEAYLLVLMEEPEDTKQWEFSTCPIMTVNTFIQIMEPQQ